MLLHVPVNVPRILWNFVSVRLFLARYPRFASGEHFGHRSASGCMDRSSIR